MSTKHRKILKAATKRQPRTASELASKAGLSAVDGSGRAIVRDLNILVSDGLLVRHTDRDHCTYTKVA